MNLFENILNQFTGKQEQPQSPSFAIPQAPRTSSYVAPNITFGQPSLKTGGGATMQQRPINTSLPKWIPEPYLPLDNWQDTRSREERPVYNFLQGVADVVTSLPGRFQETVEVDKKRFEEGIKNKQKTFVSQMISEWYNENDIFKALDQLKAKWEFDFKHGISESIVGGIGERLQSNIDTTERLSKIQDPFERTMAGVLPYAGQTVATALQPLSSTLEPFVSPVVQKIVEKTGQTQNIQELSNQWSQFEKTNPILAENIAGALNVAQLAPVPFAKPIGNAIEQWVKTGAKAIVRWAEVVAPRVVEGIKTGVKATEEWIGKVTKSIVSQQSGLWTPSIESILKNPELQSKIRSWELSAARTLEEARTSIDALREWFRETGKMYDTIRKSDVKVSTNEAKQVLLSQLEWDGLATGWKLNLVDLPVKDRWAITQALKYIDEYKWEMTPQSALSIRQKLDDLINYKSDVGSNWQRIVTGLRAKYDEFLGNKLPWLKDIDAKYAPERQFWESIRKDIYKADWTLKDNALSVVSNITNKGNEARLARMESILPWIGEKVKALRAFEDIQASSGIKVWTYARNLSTVWLATVNPILALWAWVATHPVVVARVLESIGLASQKIKSILAKWKNITKEEATIIQKAVANTPKSKVEWIINNLSYDPKTSKLTSKTLVKKPVSKPLIKNESKVNKPVSSDTTTNVFGETIDKPSNKKGGFIKIPEIGKKTNNPIVNEKTWETLNQAIEKLRWYGWEESKIQKFKNTVLWKWPKKIIYPKWTITSVNPTSSLFVDYNPQSRMTAPLAKNIVTLDKTSWKSPDTIVTIYRWAPKIQKEINPWDFITTNYDNAKSYTNDKWVVLSKKVKMSDILDDMEDPSWNWWEEYLYRPTKKVVSRDSRQPTVKNPLVEEARKK